MDNDNLLHLQVPQPNQTSKSFIRNSLILTSFTIAIFTAVVIGWMSFRSVPTMKQADIVMKKSEVLFDLLWKNFCNETQLIPPSDCAILHP